MYNLSIHCICVVLHYINMHSELMMNSFKHSQLHLPHTWTNANLE